MIKQRENKLEQMIAAEMIELAAIDREMQELMRSHRRVSFLAMVLREYALQESFTSLIGDFNPKRDDNVIVNFSIAEVDWLLVSEHAWDMYETVRKPSYRIVFDIAYVYENVAELRVRSLAIDHKKVLLPIDTAVNIMDENGESTYSICAEGVNIEGGPCNQGYAMWLYGVLDTLMTRYAPEQQ